MAREPNVVAKGSKPPEPEKSKRAAAKPAVSTQEAKDLRTLISTLSEKNSPQSSKDVTALAKQTLKVVAQSQKSESAAFRKEATKALFDFKQFVEKTDKVNETRRAKLMSDIDGVALDAKSASFMMLSVAKAQAKNIKEEATRVATAEKIKIKAAEKTILTEANVKAKAMEKEAKLKSKAIVEEQSQKMRTLSDERKANYKARVDAHNVANQAKKDKLKADKDNFKLAMEARKLQIDKERADFKQEKEDAKDKLRQDRIDSANQVKKIKNDLKDNHRNKMVKLKADNDQRKIDAGIRARNRVDKLREMKENHKAKLKKIEDDHKADAVLRKLKLKEEFNAINEDSNRRKEKHNRNADQLTEKIKSGIYDANPLIHAMAELTGGLVGHIAKRLGDRKKEKALNRLQHRQNTNATPNPSPNGTPAPTPPANPGQPAPAGNSNGMLGGLMSMLPSVSGFISGLFSVFSSIGRIGGKMFSIIGGAKAIPVIGTAIMIVNGIFDFMDGFNNAAALFGDASTGSVTQKLFSGIVNIAASLWGMVDDIAGWFGLDLGLKEKFQKVSLTLYKSVSGVVDGIVDGVKGIFESIMNTIRSIAGGIGKVLSYIPGAGDASKSLLAYADSKGQVSSAPTTSAASAIAAKKSEVNNLQDEVEMKKAGVKPTVQVVADNSVKTSQTNIITQKLDTRNGDATHRRYGYGASANW